MSLNTSNVRRFSICALAVAILTVTVGIASADDGAQFVTHDNEAHIVLANESLGRLPLKPHAEGESIASDSLLMLDESAPGSPGATDAFEYVEKQGLEPDEGLTEAAVVQPDAVPSSAQGANCNTGYGSISPSTKVDRWTYNATAGESLTIRVTRTSGNLDGYLRLFSPSGQRLAYDDDSGGSLNPMLSYRISSSGRYVMEVTSWAQRSTGNYRIAVCSASVPSGSCQGTRTSIMSLVTGSVPANGRVSYCFPGWAGRWVSIRAVATSGSRLDTVLALYDPSGRRIAWNDDAFGFDTNSMVVAYLPTAGDYRLDVTGWGASSGGFRAHIAVNRKATVADADGDCRVGLSDDWLVRSFFGTRSHNDETWNADINLDGMVNAADLAYVLIHWGKTCR